MVMYVCNNLDCNNKRMNIDDEKLFNKLLRTPGSKEKLASALFKYMSKERLARKLMAVQPIPEGALPIYGEPSEEEKLVERISNKSW